MQEMGACKVCKGIVDNYPAPKSEVKVQFTCKQINDRLGTNLSDDDILKILKSLGFEISEVTGEVDTDAVFDKISFAAKHFAKSARELAQNSEVDDFVKNLGSTVGELIKRSNSVSSTAYEAIVPDWRNDVTLPEDLSEEVARIYGFDKIPATLPKGSQQGRQSKVQNFTDKIKTVLTSLGMDEEISFAFTSFRQITNTC